MKTIVSRPVQFSAFIACFGLELEISSRYRARLKSVEIKDGGVLIGAYGDGDTKQCAIDDYAEQLSGKLIVVDAYSDNRREIQCPSKWLPEST